MHEMSPARAYARVDGPMTSSGFVTQNGIQAAFATWQDQGAVFAILLLDSSFLLFAAGGIWFSLPVLFRLAL